MTARHLAAMLCGAALLVSGCGRTTTVSGTLAEGESADSVWDFAGDERAEVDADSFTISGLRGEVIDLRFIDGDDLARMEIRGAAGEEIHLRDVWLDDGVAYPSSVRIGGGGTVTVNGIRMMDPDRLPAEIDAEGTVLARSGSGDALLVRPADSSLPDLRVVVTPATSVASPDGDPVEAKTAEEGDTVRVRGRTENGYLVAAEMVLPRRAATREDSGPRLLGRPVSRGEEPAVLGVPARRDEPKEEGWGQPRDDDRGRGWGRSGDRGRGKGNGKG